MPDVDLSRRQPVVLAVTDHTADRAATLWAADEAACQGRPLRVLSVPDGPDPASARRAWRSRARRSRAFGDAEALIRERHPDLDVRERLVDGTPGALFDESVKDAAMVVVGGPGTSTTDELLGQATCPVAVVPPTALPADDASPVIVVGVGSPATSDAALAYAFHAAVRRHSTVLAIAVLPPPSEAGPYSHEDIRAAEHALREQVRPWSADYPHVSTLLHLEAGSPSEVLPAQAAKAHALVIGEDPGFGGPEGSSHASTDDGLLRRAPGPVVVVPRQSPPRSRQPARR